MDIIQRKLELIDFKLALGPGYVVSRIINAAPLILPAGGLIAGIILQYSFEFPVIVWLVLSVFFAVLAFGYIAVKRKESNLRIIAYLAIVSSICLGAIRLNSYRYLPANDVSNFVGSERTLATIRGIIISEPYISDNNNWVFSKYKFTDPTSSFYLKITEAQGKSGWFDASGVVRVQVDESIKDIFKAGDNVQMYCWLERIWPATNPGEFDFAKKLAKENIYVAATIKTRDGIEVLSNQSKIPSFSIHRFLNKTATTILTEGLPEGDPNSNALIEALVLGSRTKIDSETHIAFRKTGLLHFVSLSGLNFVIMIAFVWWLCKLTGFGKKRQAIICIAVSILFVMAVPPNPPVLRAAVISIVFCASFLFIRQPNSFNSLALSAIILLLFKPVDIFNTSWQLSFSTTLGILLFFRRIQLFLYEKKLVLLKLILKKEKLFLLINENSLFALSGLFSIGLSAWVCGAGFMLYYFYTITPLSAIWTVLASPFVSVIMIAGMLKIVVSFFSPTAAYVLGLVANVFSDSLIWLVKIFAKVSFSEILVGDVPKGVIIFYYCVLFFAAFFFFRRPLLRKVISIVLITAFAITLFAIKFQRVYRGELVLSCIDVSHGQAILVQPPGAANLLFDAGSLYKSNVGRRIIIPFLRSQGVGKLDAIIISHNDIDHINAIPEVVEDTKTADIFANDDFLTDAESDGIPKFLNDYLKKSGINIQGFDSFTSAAGGDKNFQIKSPAVIKIIWPSKEAVKNNKLSDNDRSAVTLIEYGGVKILLCSDIEKFTQQKILEIYPDLKADIVIAPHHGSVTTTDDDFIERLSPKFLVYSCDEDQYQNQSKKIIKSATRLFTARDGLVRISVSSKGKIICSSFIK
jgi:competence protein ComEC